MIAPRTVAALVALVVVSAPAERPLQAQGRERALYVSVVNEAGAPVRDLGPADFVVREDNMAREVLKVQPAVEPMHVALLVDTSAASQENISHFRTALPSFVAALTSGAVDAPKSQVAIVGIGERPTIHTDYTSNTAELQKGVNRLWSIQGTGAYLLDAILEVVEGFKKRESRRPVIVAITAEGQEFSHRHYDQVLGPLRNSGASLYALMLGQPSGSITPEAQSRNIVLDQGTRDTGGLREQLLTPMGLNGKLKLLADQLTHQYLVTYARPESLIPPEKVAVTAAKPGMTARGTLVREPRTR